MKLLICNCDRWCKSGRKNPYWKKTIKGRIKNFRMKVRQELKASEYDKVPISVIVGHTD